MACVILVVLAMVVPLALCRRSPSSARSFAKIKSGLESSTEDQLRIFATTFNSANVDMGSFSQRRIDRLIERLTDGHEDPGDEADMVILGFQEFLDPGHKFGIEAKSSHLWKHLSKKKMAEIQDLVKDTLEIPQHVHAAKNSLSEDFQAYYNKIQEHLLQFKGEFGERGHKFHEYLGVNSKLTPWATEIQNQMEELQLALGERKVQQQLHDKNILKTQYHTLDEAAQNLKQAISTYPKEAHIRNKMKPIHTWIVSVTQKLQQIRNRYPNIGFTVKGQQAWDSLINNIDKENLVQEDLIQKNFQHTSLHSDTQAMEDSIKKWVKHDEDLLSTRLYADLSQVSDAVKRLTHDINFILSNGKKNRDIAHNAAKGSRPWEHKMDQTVNTWVKSTNQSFGCLLHPESFRMDHEHFEVGRFTQTLHSGYSCHLVTHYDTILYVYTNPWSDWKISAIDYTSNECQRQDTTDSGCNIDNTQRKECGKAVNLLVFKAQKHDKSIRVCALNTHMSYAGEAAQRMQYIRDAVFEATHAKCDTLVFVGDFNSRMHCDATPHLSQATPPYDRLDPKTNSSFRYLLNLICPGGRCALKGLSDKIRYYDELMQMMELENVYCMEQRKQTVNMFSSKTYWKRIWTKNDLKTMGVFEAGVPDWSPTYKVGPRRIYPDVPEEWRHCEEGELNCLRNSDKKGKHNLAWTDRILLWPFKGGKAIPLSKEYSRRSISSEFDSDHIPVVAKVTIMVP